MLARDLVQYERKAKLYLEMCAAASRDNNQDDPARDVTVKNNDPLQFWIAQVLKLLFVSKFQAWLIIFFKDVTSDFKTDICQVALDLLCIPATSTDCERLFSAAGYLSQNRASSISPKNLERRCLLKTNQTIWIMIGLFNIKLLFVRNKFAWIGILFLFLASVGVYFVLIGEST